jgi:hypothetical protein
MADPTPCGATTEHDEPCKKPPMTGTDGRCAFHAQLPLTDGQLNAARKNALKHGIFATGACVDAQDEAVYEELLESLPEGSDPITRQLVAALGMRAARVLRWEAKSGTPTPLAGAAVQGFLKAKALLPPPEKTPAQVDPLAVLTIVERQLKDPELLLKQIPGKVRDKVRALLLEGGMFTAKPATA